MPRSPQQKPAKANPSKTPQKPTPAVPESKPSVQGTSATPVRLPFLLKATITAIVRNAAGLEERRTFDAVFEVDRKGAETPWFILRNFLAPQFLNQKLGREGTGWLRIYEAKTEKIINRDNPADIDGIPLRVMTIEQLESYVGQWEYPIKVREFHNVEYARQMVALYEEDPKGYEKQYEGYVAGKGRQMPELDRYRKGAISANSDSLLSEFESLSEKPLNTPKTPSARQVSGPLSPEEARALETPAAPEPAVEQPAVPAAPASAGSAFGDL